MCKTLQGSKRKLMPERNNKQNLLYCFTRGDLKGDAVLKRKVKMNVMLRKLTTVHSRPEHPYSWLESASDFTDELFYEAISLNWDGLDSWIGGTQCLPSWTFWRLHKLKLDKLWTLPKPNPPESFLVMSGLPGSEAEYKSLLVPKERRGSVRFYQSHGLNISMVDK